MKKILHVSCSPRGQAAESHRLSQKIIGFLLQKETTAVLVNRVIGGGAISHVDENYAISQQSSADISQEGSIARSEELIAEWRVQTLWLLELPCITSPCPPR
jgi:FMN-dependent NADH-azoreductase